MKYIVRKKGVDVLSTSRTGDVESLVGIKAEEWHRVHGSVYDQKQLFGVETKEGIFSIVKTLYESKYRLKKEIRGYFNRKLSNSVDFIDYWKEAGVEINALEEVKVEFISSGTIASNKYEAIIQSFDRNNIKCPVYFKVNIELISKDGKNRCINTKDPFVSGINDMLGRELELYI